MILSLLHHIGVFHKVIYSVIFCNVIKLKRVAKIKTNIIKYKWKVNKILIFCDIKNIMRVYKRKNVLNYVGGNSDDKG